MSGFSTAKTSKALILSGLHLHTPGHLQSFTLFAGQILPLI